MGIAKNHEHIVLYCFIDCECGVLILFQPVLFVVKGQTNGLVSVNIVPAVSSVHDKEHQTDNLLISLCILLRATKYRLETKHEDLCGFRNRGEAEASKPRRS